MGDPRKLRKKYETPKKVWDKDRILEETSLMNKYGLKNMRELWRAALIIKKVRREVRKLFSLEESVSVKRGEKILTRLVKLGIASKDTKIEEVLSFTVEDVLKRRLQSQVVQEGLAKNVREARQLIVHGFISVNGKRVTRPSYLVKYDEKVGYYKPVPIHAAANSGSNPVKDAHEVKGSKDLASESNESFEQSEG